MSARRLLGMYNKLLAAFGPRTWWPADSPEEVILGAILTQNTNWTNVEKAIGNLKKAGVLTPARLHALDVGALAELIRPAGYFNIKAGRLKHFLDRLFEQVFDLAVHAAEFGLRPGFQLSPERRIHPQQEALAFGHVNLGVERAGVHNGMHLRFAAEHDHEVADHRSLALVIERQHLLLGKVPQRHLNHAHGAMHNLLARGDDGLRLLAAQHARVLSGRRDLGPAGRVRRPLR